MVYSVAVVGTGRVGTALAMALAGAGHEVVLASRSPNAAGQVSLEVWDIPAAIKAADAVVLATPGAAVAPLLEQFGELMQDLAVIDATNSMGGGPMHHADSAVGLSYYRAFNTLGVENFEQPRFGDERADLFYSGPPVHQAMVEELIVGVGLRPVYVGDGVAAADLLDGVTRLWFTLALQQGYGRHVALRVLT
jgi:8-hydroxy-5-deazaflavin:NADPH oxidoreductase